MDCVQDRILLLLVRNFVFGSKSYLPTWLIVESKSNCWVRRARRARIRRLLTPEHEYGVRLTPESQVKSNCLSVAFSDHGTHLETPTGIVTWIIFLRSRTPEYVAKSIAFFRLLYESRWALTGSRSASGSSAWGLRSLSSGLSSEYSLMVEDTRSASVLLSLATLIFLTVTPGWWKRLNSWWWLILHWLESSVRVSVMTVTDMWLVD